MLPLFLALGSLPLVVGADWFLDGAGDLAMSEGTKGPRLFDWTCLPIWHQGSDDGWHSLLLRRTIELTPDLTYYLVFSPPDTPLQAKITALGGRWRVEEDFENGKDLGFTHIWNSLFQRRLNPAILIETPGSAITVCH
jgi:hypothetical protein